MEKINIAEILKNAPNGTKLYSPVLGEVYLSRENVNNKFPIRVVKEHAALVFTEYGQLIDGYGECLLFPSKDQQDWSKFNVPERELQKGSRVMVSDTGDSWALGIYCANKRCEGRVNSSSLVEWKYIVPVSEFDFDDIKSNKERSI